MTLAEVMIACCIVTMVLLGTLQGMLQSRRITEGSIRQTSVASLVQGYLEQMKSLTYPNNPVSPTTTPGTGLLSDWQALNTVPGSVLTAIDSNQNTTYICLAAGSAPTSLPAINTLPTDASMHTEIVNIDSTSSNCTLKMWVWVNPLTGTNISQCEAIVIVYQWTTMDGGRIHNYSAMARAIRSVVQTD